MTDIEPEYRDGWPASEGWFDVTNDGEDDRLRHWICKLSGRHEWIDINGDYVRGHNIRWTGEAGRLP